MIWAEQGAIGDRGTNPVLRRLRVFVEWGVLALAPGTEQKGLLSALQAGEPSGQRSPTGVFVLPKASTFPSLTISLSLSLLCPPPSMGLSYFHCSISSLYILEFVPVLSDSQALSLIRCSGFFFPSFLSACHIRKKKSFSGERNVAAHYTDKFETNKSSFLCCLLPLCLCVPFFILGSPPTATSLGCFCNAVLCREGNPTKNISSNSRTKKKN